MYEHGEIDSFFRFPNPPSHNAEIPEVERLARAFADHEAHERDSLQEYGEAAGRTRDPLLGFLLDLVVADEERHHVLIGQIAQNLNASLTWKAPPSPLPFLGRLTTEERDRLLRLTSAFIKEEKRGVSECRTLMKTSKAYYNGLLPLLLRTVIHDSEKHLMILRFIKQQLRNARPQPEAGAESGRAAASVL
jgi:hypothetical protein